MRKARGFVFWSFLLVLVASCSDKKESLNDFNPKVLNTQGKYKGSTTIGNFVTTAVQRANRLDFVFLPADYFADDMYVNVDLNMSDEEIQKVVDQFPDNNLDPLLIGTMKGEKIKEFLIDRSREIYDVELETAGLWYNISFYGGIVSNASFSVDGLNELEDDTYYRVAVSDEYFFGLAFPGYKFRNGFNFNFRRTKYIGSVRESVKSYLKEAVDFPVWTRQRATVTRAASEEVGFKKISEIQGPKHASPLLNKTVRTTGVITAVGTPDWYPWGIEFYIESIEPDEDLRTSEALHVHHYGLNTFGLDLKIGDYVEVTGTVYEDIRENGMGDTTLRFLEDITLIQKNWEHQLPPPQELSLEERQVPHKTISSYGGRLMEKNALNLEDGVDFWESLEGMRIKFKDPVILGFRGGNEDYFQINIRPFLNLYVTPKEFVDLQDTSHKGGLMITDVQGDRNPEIFSIITNHLTHKDNLDTEKYYSVGDVFEGEVEGVLIYNRNIFSGGEYSLVLPKVQTTISESEVPRRSEVSLKDRPVTALSSDDPKEVTVATYNLENLSAFQINRKGQERMEFMADSIVTNLRCPDVLNLVEIQDNNGIDFRGTQDDAITLRRLRALVQSSCLTKNYDMVEVQPFLHGEGGQPGGNIRVAIMYNKNKLGIDYRSDGAYGTPAVVFPGGRLSNNPGRVYPNNEAFRRSRRSLVVEFDVLAKPGEKLYLIGNHLNSKLGDMDFWGNQQIARPASDDKRVRKSAMLHQFIVWLQDENPKANIVVLGDFNALAEEDSMKVLTNKERTLQNMIFTLPLSHRYTTNHNGSSQPLDYIFVNSHITKTKSPLAEVLHINSDYMAKLSDHDPVMLKLSF